MPEMTWRERLQQPYDAQGDARAYASGDVRSAEDILDSIDDAALAMKKEKYHD